MVVATAMGFYYFTTIQRPLESPMMLDVVLLSVCIVGPIILDTFAVISVISGNDNKVEGWFVTLVLPIVDICQCVSQVNPLK